MTSPATLGLVPERTFFRAAPERTVLRAVLGLTFYLDARDPSARPVDVSARLAERFLDVVGPVPYFTTSRLDRWVEVDDRAALLGLLHGPELAIESSARHLLELTLADDVDAAALSLRVREVAPGSEIPGFVQLALPLGADPAVLLDLARSFCEDTAVLTGTAGYTFRWVPEASGNAAAEMFKICKRFLGFDVQVPELFAIHARSHVPPASWLTVVSHRHPGRGPVIESLEAAAGIALEPFRSCVLVRAGDTPTLGDVNTMDLPMHVATAARAFAPLSPDPPPRLPGPFAEDDGTARWCARLTDPAGWM